MDSVVDGAHWKVALQALFGLSVQLSEAVYPQGILDKQWLPEASSLVLERMVADWRGLWAPGCPPGFLHVASS